MAFSPTTTEIIARARTDLRLGLPVVMAVDAQDGGLIFAAAETLSANRFAFFTTSNATLAITARRAATLKITAYDGDLARITLPGDATPHWVNCVIDPARDLTLPMLGPFHTQRGGDAMPFRLALQLIKSTQLLPAVIALAIPNAAEFAQTHGLGMIRDTALADDLAQSHAFHRVSAANVPFAVSQSGRVHVYRPDNGDTEHYAIEIGRPDFNNAVLTRLHSACFTGDVLGSLKCDCGPQLQSAMAQMAQAGGGVLLYLNQEGRGIGLANKMRAYTLQDQGFDTVEANHRLGFEDDERDFRIGARLLQQMNINTIRLMTNNPRKVSMMQNTGITVAERVPLIVQRNPHNTDYLTVKAQKSGHIL